MAQETDTEKIARLEREIERLPAEKERLRRALEEALRAGKRQAAPFSRRQPKANPPTPGRKAGPQYGPRSRREIPERVDEVVEVPWPARCPHCGGQVEETGVVSQYQTEIPEPRVERMEFRIHHGRCRRCRQAVEGRDRRQSSRAVGSAASQVGPRAVALATQWNKGLGLPYGKTAAVLEHGGGLRVSRGGLCQAVQRVARKAEPTYAALREKIRCEPSVTPEETGWKVGGHLWWMWACGSPRMTVYAIQPGRGFEPAAAVLGEGFDGFLVRDGGSVYRQFAQALHQTCLAHLRRRCREMIEVAETGGARFPRAIQTLLQSALRLRDRRDQEQIRPRGLAVARGQLEARLDRVLQKRTRSPAHRRLANHLVRERDAVFTFLYCPGLEATNGRAEQALRPRVVPRKVWGGNRTAAGAQAQSVLRSILETCRQHQRPVLPLLQRLLCSPRPRVFDLTTPGRLSR